MAQLIYSAITSLDGYVADEHGNFDWAEPDDGGARVRQRLERPIGTYLYGRRMYETMVYWETAPTDPDESAIARDYTEIWQAADKVVYSTTLETVSSKRTRLERTFDPEAVRQMKAEATRDLSVGGPHLAAVAIAAGLVDEYQLLRQPDRGGWRQRCAPRPCPRRARAHGRAPVRRRRRVPAATASPTDASGSGACRPASCGGHGARSPGRSAARAAPGTARRRPPRAGGTSRSA